MMKKHQDGAFSRILPKVTHFTEKPMAQWASGKIKRIYDGYGAFCEEIEKLLGEPQEKPQVSGEPKPEFIEEFEALWQDQESPVENAKQLLTILSGFYAKGFVLKRVGGVCRVLSFFADSPHAAQGAEFETLLRPFHGDFGDDRGLKPECSLDAASGSLAVHFWLCPEEGLSLLVCSDMTEPQRRTVVLKTQALIQRRFYD